MGLWDGRYGARGGGGLSIVRYVDQGIVSLRVEQFHSGIAAEIGE